MGEISLAFDCEVRHSYCEPVNAIWGSDSYDRGEHVGSGGLLPAPGNRNLLFLVEDPDADSTLSTCKQPGQKVP